MASSFLFKYYILRVMTLQDHDASTIYRNSGKVGTSMLRDQKVPSEMYRPIDTWEKQVDKIELPETQRWI